MTRFDSSREILSMQKNTNWFAQDTDGFTLKQKCNLTETIISLKDVPPAKGDMLLVFHPGGCDRSSNVRFYTTLKAHVAPADDFHTLRSRDNQSGLWERCAQKHIMGHTIKKKSNVFTVKLGNPHLWPLSGLDSHLFLRRCWLHTGMFPDLLSVFVWSPESRYGGS